MNKVYVYALAQKKTGSYFLLGAMVSEFRFFKRMKNTANLRKSCLLVFHTLLDIFIHLFACSFFFSLYHTA